MGWEYILDGTVEKKLDNLEETHSDMRTFNQEFAFPFKILQQHVDCLDMSQILPWAHNSVYLLYMMVPCTSLLEHIAVLESSIDKVHTQRTLANRVHKT